MYQYDIFISYKRAEANKRNIVNEWMDKIFYWRFESWFEEKYLALSKRKPVIFRDTDIIKAGDPWPLKIQDALRTSKILVAICSPQYFYSEWCKSEWKTFEEREKILRQSLRVPVRHNDCEDYLNGIEYCDCYDFTTLAEDFFNSLKGAEFDNKIRDLAEVVANKAYIVTEFHDNWPVLNLSDESAPNLKITQL